MAKGAGPIKSQNKGWSALAAAIVLESRSVRVKLKALMSLVGRSVCRFWKTVNRCFARRVSICKLGRGIGGSCHVLTDFRFFQLLDEQSRVIRTLWQKIIDLYVRNGPVLKICANSLSWRERTFGQRIRRFSQKPIGLATSDVYYFNDVSNTSFVLLNSAQISFRNTKHPNPSSKDIWAFERIVLRPDDPSRTRLK